MEVGDIISNVCFDDLSDEEILWYKFASKLGFDYHGLHTIIKNKETGAFYKVLGLVWKYSRINISDANNIIDNELYVHLKFYKREEEKPKIVVELEENKDDVKRKYIASLPSGCSFEFNSDAITSSIDASSMFSSCSTFNPDDLNKPKRNEKIDYADGLFLTLNDFVTQYDVKNIIKEKKDFFKLKYSIGVLWT